MQLIDRLGQLVHEISASQRSELPVSKITSRSGHNRLISVRLMNGTFLSVLRGIANG